MKYIFFFVITMLFFGFFIRRFRRKSIICMLVLLLGLLLIYPQISLQSAKEGINLWLFIVVPSLLPFFIINDMLVSLRVPGNIGRLFSPAARFLFGTSGYGAYVFIMSIFAGYPAGARIVAQLIEEKRITAREGEKILTFSSTSGPLFIIGAVGSGMLKSAAAGYILYASHVLGAVVNGIVLRVFLKKRNNYNNSVITESLNKPSSGDMLSRGIMTSLVTCGFIGGYIILFCVINSLLNELHFFKILNDSLKYLGFLSPEAINAVCILLESSVEITNGSKIISTLSINFDLKLILLSFIIAFSGLSILGQVSSVLNKTKVNMKTYILCKLSHGMFSSIACFLILKTGMLNVSAFTKSLNSFMPGQILNLFVFLIVILILNILGSVKSMTSKNL